MEAARERVLDWLVGHISTLTLVDNNKDPKTRLQEFLQSRQSELPRYEVIESSGEAHCRTFKVDCQVDLLAQPTFGEGNSRRLAEQKAAQLALIALGVEKADD